MNERKMFSEVLAEYISVCLNFEKEKRDLQEKDYYYHYCVPIDYQDAQERKNELAKEVDSFFL